MADPTTGRTPGAHGPGGSGPTPDALIDHIARLEADGWTVERVEHVAGNGVPGVSDVR